MGNEISLKDALNRFIDSNKLRPKLDEQTLIASWEELVGRHIYSQTKDMFIKNEKLYVKIESSVIRQELSFMRTRLVNVINRRFGEGFIKEIVLL